MTKDEAEKFIRYGSLAAFIAALLSALIVGLGVLQKPAAPLPAGVILSIVLIVALGYGLRKVWFDANVFDGSTLRISFSPDGALRHDRIEVANHWRPEFQKLVELISSVSPEKWKISFRERVAHLEHGHIY